MKKIAKRILLVVLLLISIGVFSQDNTATFNAVYKRKTQKIAIVSGEMAKLNDIKSLIASINFDDLKLGLKGEEDSVYIKRKVEELNAKISGKGDKWRIGWEQTMTTFLPAFIEGYNQAGKKSNIPSINLPPDAGSVQGYTITIRPIFDDFNEWSGHSVGMYIDIAKADKPDEILVRFLMNTQPWWKSKTYKGYDAGAFFSGGKDFAYFFKKIVYKSK